MLGKDVPWEAACRERGRKRHEFVLSRLQELGAPERPALPYANGTGAGDSAKPWISPSSKRRRQKRKKRR